MSIDPRHLELMHAEIDGVISDPDREALSDFLALHPAAKAQMEELRALSHALAGVQLVEPPADLKAWVLRAVATTSFRREASLFNRIRQAWPGGQGALRYAYAAAAGLLLGIAIYHWAPGTGTGSRALDPSELVGTMAGHKAGSGASAIRELPVEFSGGSATISLWKAEAGYTIEFDVDSSSPVRVALGFDPAKATFRGFAQDPQAAQSLETQGAKIAWTQSGRRRLAILLDPRTQAETTLDIEIISGENVPSHSTMSLPGQG